MAPYHHLLVFCLLLFVAMTSCSETETESVVKTEPASVKEPTGRTASVTCTTSLNATSLHWQDANAQAVTTNTSQRVHVTSDATLMLRNLRVNDTGVYTCVTSDGAHNATAQLDIYVMPDYFTEGMIILFINAGLIVIFLGCLLHSFIKGRREKSKQSKAEMKQAL